MRREETTILRRYYDTLCCFGVDPTRYKWEDCTRDWLLVKKFTFCLSLPLTAQFLELMASDPGIYFTPEDEQMNEEYHHAGGYFLALAHSLHKADMATQAL